jgi:HEAT repeat protein
MTRTVLAACVLCALSVPAAAQTLERRIESVAAQVGVRWVAYRVPMVGGPRRMCCFDSSTQQADCCGQCRLERGDGVVMTPNDRPPDRPARLVLEPPSEMRLFVRLENGAVVRLRTFSLDCDVDAGGMPVVWLDNVGVDESAAWLTNLARNTGSDAGPSVSSGALHQSAVSALALHPGDAALRSLIRFAREDQRARVRSQAIFWLGQRAGDEATKTIGDAIDNDPELEVKRRAVFALSQLPRGEGVPLLMALARTHRQPDIRRQAMFWLGQSKDPRAVDFFEQILKP